MKKKSRVMESFVRPFLVLLLLGSAALGHQSDLTSEEELKRQRQRLQAISIAKQAAAEAPLWDNKKAAVQVLTDAADLLWDETPNQCAAWLRTAWALTDQVSGSPKNESLKEFFTRSDQGELRTVVLAIAREHDPDLAEKLLQQLSQQEPHEKEEHGTFDDRSARSEYLLQLAQQAVDSNPDVAFALAEKSLTDGVSYSLQNIMTSLRKKNVELANRLFDLALARFSSRVPDPSEGQVLAGYLFQSGFTFAANSSGQTMLVVNPSQQNLPAVATSEPQRAKSFLIAAYEVLLSRPVALVTPEAKLRGAQTLALGNRLVRPFDTFAPELSPAAQGFLAQLRRQLLPEGQVTESETTALTTSSGPALTKGVTKEKLYEERIAELEDRADKERNAAFKKAAYTKAAVATKPEDYQRAKRMAEKIDDDNLRADVVSFVLYRAALFFVEPSIEKSIEITPQISDLSRRDVIKIAIVQRLLLAKSGRTEPGVVRLDQQRAFDLLTDIERDLKKAEPSPNVAKISLARTSVLGELDPAQALLALDQAVQMINKLDTFNLRDGTAPNLGLGVAASSGATVARPRVGFDLRSAIDPLILSHFEQVSAIVERLTSKDLNGLARVEVAKLFLKKSASFPKHAATLMP